MIDVLPGMPDGVVGVETRGKLSAEDYRDVLMPALAQAAQSGELRCVLVIDDFDGMTAGAMWDDVKLGVEHLRKWRRLAVVTDLEWMRHLVGLFTWTIPGQVKVFPRAAQSEAVTWAAASD